VIVTFQIEFQIEFQIALRMHDTRTGRGLPEILVNAPLKR